VIGRLPIYLRTLKLLLERGAQLTSSQELGDLLGISSAQIRKDLSHFGEFGKQGTGYNIAFLCKQLEKILKVDCVWPVILVGAGNLGRALASYNGFEERGFRIVALFDNDPSRVGEQEGLLTVLPLEHMHATVRETHCQVAILAVPAAAAQAVSESLIRSGIRSILCYAPITLNVPAQVRVEYIDPVIAFQHMTYYLDRQCVEE
jgi:redox-sensing transcriptional repressor